MGTLYHQDVGCGDCSVIKANDGATFLVDCHRLSQHSGLLPISKRIRGLFVTHQHFDHYSGLEFLKTNGYSIDCLIYSPYQRRHGDNSVLVEDWNKFNSYCTYFKNRGTKLFSPYRQTSFAAAYWKTNGIAFWMLGPHRDVATSDTRQLHDACLVIKAHLGSRQCLFTGDASDKCLNRIANSTTNICNDILHGSHHGSLEGADLEFVKKCNSKYTVISTKSGVYENVPHPTALQRYRSNTKNKVYRTDTNGSLNWTF